MKLLIPIFGLLVTLTFSACSLAEQDPNALGDKFQQGLTGQGKIVPNNPTTDSFGNEYR